MGQQLFKTEASVYMYEKSSFVFIQIKVTNFYMTSRESERKKNGTITFLNCVYRSKFVIDDGLYDLSRS